MNMADLVVTSGLIAHKGPTSVPQLIQVTAHTEDIETGVLDLTWQNVGTDGSAAASSATAKLIFGDSRAWITSWSPMAYLVQHRIEMLQQIAANGQASRLSRKMAYTLFANNLVDYADKYRGMQSVSLTAWKRSLKFSCPRKTMAPSSRSYLTSLPASHILPASL